MGRINSVFVVGFLLIGCVIFPSSKNFDPFKNLVFAEYSDYYSSSSSYGGYGGGSYGGGSYYSGGGGHNSRGALISLDLDPKNILNTSLRVASREGRHHDVESLLDQGAEVDSRTDSGETPLMNASRHCSIKLAKLLIHHGANVNATDLEGRTALIHASRESCSDIVALLIKQPKIEFNVKDQNGKAAFDYAEDNSISEVDGPSQQIMAMIDKAKRLRKSGPKQASRRLADSSS